MKTCRRILQSVGMNLVALAVVGCATSPTPMPSFETEEQLAAAQVCQIVYSCSNRACADLRPIYNRPRPISRRCLALCETCLGQCYQGCESRKRVSVEAS